MLNTFLDKTCTIYSFWVSIVDGQQIKADTAIYTSISCDFYPAGSDDLTFNEYEQDYKKWKYTVVLNGDKTLVRIGHKVNLVDPAGQDYGNFIVDEVMPYRGINGQIDNITLKVSAINE